MSVPLRPCPACAELVFLNTCRCPHCGEAKVCRARTLPATALLMGLTLASTGCNQKGQADYSGAATTDYEEESNDRDDDGWEKELDCDDSDSRVHPEAPEVPEDGIDSNCDGDDNPALTDDYDEDGVTVGDGDCNDLEAAIHPGAEETAGDGMDSNCNGEDDT
jgi:hypothetical protein